MRQESITTNDSLIPSPPIPDSAHVFSKRMHCLLNGQPKDDATIARAMEGLDDLFDMIAAGLYSLASMLVGEGEDGVRLVETAIANGDRSVCSDPAQARQSSRRALCEAALGIIEQRTPGCLAAPEGLKPAKTCIEDDDLDAAGAAREDLARMITGPGRDRVRHWLASLPTGLRVVFALRAVAGFTAAETAAMLAAQGGPLAAGWTADAVRETFRQALCSLASQLLHASAAR
jgi:DNA-directed RNA polymerase specialized sigma24 family protein